MIGDRFWKTARRSARHGAVGVVFALLAAPGMAEELVVEAEAYRGREPADGSFARPHSLRWASGRSALIRFHGEGRASWEVDVPRAGTWSLWLRYAAASETSTEYGFGTAERLLASGSITFPATGALEGKRAWEWRPLCTRELAAGAHAISLLAAPIRPDCFVLTDATGEPTHATPPPVPVPDAATQARLDRSIIGGSIAAVTPARDYSLPAWFDEHRVCMHTRLSPVWLLTDTFTTAAASFRSLGVPVFVRHLKTHGEGAWWPSAVGPKEKWGVRVDVARGIIERAHAADCRLIAYYRHMEDEGMAERHPEWVCRDDRGEPYARRGGAPMLCLGSPYADFVEARLLELVDRGADGFYFDELHMPPLGCWCESCRSTFSRMTGLEHPAVADEEDPVHRRLQDFTNLTIERCFARWRSALHARNPEVVLLVGSYRAPDFLERHISGRLLRIADSVKTEFDKGGSGRGETFFARHPDLREPPRDVRMALGWTWCRDGADGRPPHVWIPRPSDDRTARAATAAVIGHGGIANLDHSEETLPDPETFGASIALGNLLSEHLGGMRPLRWAAVHVPEVTRDRLAPDVAAWWREGYAGAAGAYEALLRARLPVGIVTDDQLIDGALDGYSVLYLPAPRDLTPAMREAADRFATSGGLLVEAGVDEGWHDPARFSGAADRFRAITDSRRGEVPFDVTGGPDTLHAIPFVDPDSDRRALVLLNDFSWVRTAGGRSGEPPPPVDDVIVQFLPPAETVTVTEVVSGKALSVTSHDEATYLRVPPFDSIAVLVW